MDMRMKRKGFIAIMGTLVGLLAVSSLLFPERVAAYSAGESFLYAPIEMEDISGPGSLRQKPAKTANAGEWSLLPKGTIADEISYWANELIHFINDVLEGKGDIENGSAAVSGDSINEYVIISKEDRSYDLVSDGVKYYEVENYYEEALLSDFVNNSDRINAAINNKKEEFFKEKSVLDDSYSEYEQRERTEERPEQMDLRCDASVRSVYLDDNYYSVNIELNNNYSMSGYSGFIGYTFDLRTGSEVTLPEVLGMSGKDAWNLVWETIKDRYGFPEPDYFPDKDGFYIDNYCISQDGKIYVFYDRYSIGGGYLGSMGFYIKKLDKDINIKYQYISDLEGGSLVSLSDEQINAVKAELSIPDRDRVDANQAAPYCRNDRWFVPLTFTQYDNTMALEIPIASAGVDIDTGEPGFIIDPYRDTSFFTGLIKGGWWCEDFNPSLPAGEMPDFIDFTGNAMMVYDYDRENESYILNSVNYLYEVGFLGDGKGYYIEVECGGEDSERTYEAREDSSELAAYYAWRSDTSPEDYLRSYSEKDNLISAGRLFEGVDLSGIERRNSRSGSF